MYYLVTRTAHDSAQVLEVGLLRFRLVPILDLSTNEKKIRTDTRARARTFKRPKNA